MGNAIGWTLVFNGDLPSGDSVESRQLHGEGRLPPGRDAEVVVVGEAGAQGMGRDHLLGCVARGEEWQFALTPSQKMRCLGLHATRFLGPLAPVCLPMPGLSINPGRLLCGLCSWQLILHAGISHLSSSVCFIQLITLASLVP